MTRSFKHCYPFRLATTSFIYPDTYSANVTRLGHLVDEIELLVFESNQLPSKTEVGELKQLSAALDITYNVHLPLDVFLGHKDAIHRRKAVQQLDEAVERMSPLGPTTYTVHLIFDGGNDAANVKAWQQRTMDSIAQLIRQTNIAPDMLSIEILDYPPLWLKPIRDILGLAVCADIGHVLLNGYDLASVLKSFDGQISILHMHGVYKGRDHLALNQLDSNASRVMCSYLKDFTGSVSLEVFSEVNLKTSLTCLEKLMANPSDPQR